MKKIMSLFPQADTNINVIFVLDNRKYEVEQFKISFFQEIDFKQQPQHEMNGGMIYLVLSQSIDNNIYDWGKRSNKAKKGKILFQNEIEGTVLEVIFTNGHCIRLERTINSMAGTNTSLLISSGEVTLNGITHDNYWKEN